MGTVDFSKSSISRYIQLASLFQMRIKQGVWRVGERIPTIDELAAECNVARATIRQALDILEQENLIQRFRAKGTFVIRKPQDHIWLEVPTNLSGLLLSPEGASIELLSYGEHSQPPQILTPGGVLGESYFCWRRRHSRDGEPYYFGNAYIDERLRPLISKDLLATDSTLRILTNLPGLVLREIHQTLTIGSADVETAEMLGIALNAPIAHCQRTAVDEHDRIVFVGDGVYRGDILRLDIKVKI